MTTRYANILEKGSRLKKLLAASVTALALTAVLATPSWADVNGTQRLEVDYSLEFVLLEGYDSVKNVRVDVFRGATAERNSGVRIGTFTGATEQDPQGRAGFIMEINHVGGADCWQGVSTPDIQPGDKVQATTLNADGTDTNIVDYTFVRNLDYADNAGRIAGVATGVENPDGTFDVNAPLTVGDPEAGGAFIEAKRLGGSLGDQDVAIVPDANGAFDVALAGEGGEVFAQFVNGNAAGGDESTVAGPNNGEAEGIPPGCPPLAQNAMTSVSPEVVNAAAANGNVTVGGVIQDDVNVSLTLNNTALGDVTLNRDANTFSASFPAASLNEGNNTLTANFTPPGPVAPQSLNISKDTAAPSFNQSLVRTSGTYNGAFDVSLNTNDPNASIFYTRDGTNPATSNSRVRYQGGPIRINTGQTLFRAVAFDAVNNASVELSRQYTVRAATSTSLVMNTNSIKLNTRKAISGAVSPANSGNTVKLTIARPGADLVRTLSLVNGRYSFSYKATVLGIHRVSVSFAQDADSQGSTSVAKTFRVIR